VAQIETSAGPIEYEDTGGEGPVIVMIGGLAMNSSLWSRVVPRLRDGHRCVTPTMPWGGHRLPMRPDADLSLDGHARILAEFVEGLRAGAVTLVENDTGMAQVLAGRRPELIERLVITSCEAFENYPPGLPGKMIGMAGRLPGGVNLAMQPMRLRPLRRSPIALGRMAKRPIPPEITDSWFQPLLTQRAVRRDLAKYIRSVRKERLLEAAADLPAFDRPVLVVWASEDRVMPPDHGRRFADLFPHARLVEVADSYTLIPLDQPDELAAHIRGFVAEAA
jgi:pimeloyl-ACP methyl ester carboxylesterase